MVNERHWMVPPVVKFFDHYDVLWRESGRGAVPHGSHFAYQDSNDCGNNRKMSRILELRAHQAHAATLSARPLSALICRVSVRKEWLFNGGSCHR